MTFESPGNCRKTIFVVSQSESPASYMGLVDPRTTLFSSVLFNKKRKREKEEKKKKENSNSDRHTCKPSNARKENKIDETMRNSVLAGPLLTSYLFLECLHSTGLDWRIKPIISRHCPPPWASEQATQVTLNAKEEIGPLSRLPVTSGKELWSRENKVSSAAKEKGPDGIPQAVQDSLLLSHRKIQFPLKSAWGQNLSLDQVCPIKITNEVVHGTAFNLRTFHS